MHLFTISYTSYALDRRSGDCWFSGWLDAFVLCKVNSNAKFWSTRCEVRHWTESSLILISQEGSVWRNRRPRCRTVSFRGRQIAYLIYEYFGVTRANKSVEIYADVVHFRLHIMLIRNWTQSGTFFFLSMTKIPLDDISESLCKLRIRESEKDKTVVGHVWPEDSSEESRTRLSKISKRWWKEEEKDIRSKKVESSNGNYERNAVVKNQGTQQRVQRILGDCWQCESNVQCSRGDNCSPLRFTKRGKMTVESVSEFFHAAEWEKCVENSKSQRKESQW